MGAELRQTPADHDAQWFIRWATSRLLPISDSDVEAFAERVAIRLEYDTDVVRVRREVGMEWEGNRCTD